jgi:tetratricopeptide (TPR) repeat protein
LLAVPYADSTAVAEMLLKWIGDIPSSKLEFSQAMQLLRSYSLVEEVEETKSYAMHPVVHQWAHHSQGKCFATELSRLAVVTVGWAVPFRSTRDYSTLQRRLLPHAQLCFKRIVESKTYWWLSVGEGNTEGTFKRTEQGPLLDAIAYLGVLYAGHGKLGEAEQMYERALRGYEEALGPNHTSTLDTVNNLGVLYKNQGKLGEAEQMYERALRGYQEALGDDNVQGYIPALTTLENFGNLYVIQGKTAEAQEMYIRALSGLRLVFGQTSRRYLAVAAKLDVLPLKVGEKQRKLSAVDERPRLQHDDTKKSFKLSIRKLVKKVF